MRLNRFHFFLSRRLGIVRGVFFILVIYVVVSSCSKMIRSPFVKGDLSVYVFAAQQVVENRDIYLTRQSELGSGYYLYLPLLAILFVPLTYLHADIVVVIWCLLSTILVLYCIKTFYEGMSGHSFFSLPAARRWALVLVVLLGTARPILHHLAYGQVNILVLGLILTGLRWGDQKRPIAQGFATGVALVIKLIAAPTAFWQFFRDDHRTKTGFALGIAGGAFVFPGIVLGFGINAGYLRHWFTNIVFSGYGISQHVSPEVNTSIQTTLHRLFSRDAAFYYQDSPVYLTLVELSPTMISALSYVAQISILITIALFIVRFRKAGRLISKWGGAAFSLALTPLFATTTQKHYFVMLLPAYMFLAYAWLELGIKDRIFLALIVASILLGGVGSQDFLFGEFAGKVMFASGTLLIGAGFVAAAVWRVATRLEASTMNYPFLKMALECSSKR